MKLEKQKPFGSMIAGILLGAFLTIAGCFGKQFLKNCHEYTIHSLTRQKHQNWRKSQDNCSKNGGHLVCIEHEEELHFLVRKLEELEMAGKSEYFIGLQNQSSGWTWICNTNISVTPRKPPWHPSQPSGNSDCAKMYFTTKRCPVYDDIPCEHYALKTKSYICERLIRSCNETDDKKSTKPTTIHTLPAPTIATHSTITNPQRHNGGVTADDKQSTKLTTIQTLPASSISSVSAITTPRRHGVATHRENPGENVKDTSDGNSRLIIIAVSVLALIILVICVILWFFCMHQPRVKASNSKSRRPEGQQLNNCTQLRERDVCPPPEEKMDKYEDIDEIKQQNIIANIKVERKSRWRKSLVPEQKALIHAQSSDGYLVPFDESTPAGTSEKSDVLSGYTKIGQERQHVYAVVNIDNKQGKVTFHKGPVMQDGDPCPTDNGGNYNPSVDLSSLGLESDVTESEAAKANECKDYLYAVVHKTEKKRQPPQMPAPYHGLLYADLSHPPEKSDRKITRANLPTVYADIDHLKTDAMSESRFPQLSEDQLIDGPG
ncbi:uncharacterized protein [Montipora foliosa]|uniref:uncharacterized protein isoform X2 n=1 Tax=Montipora foliosa TaxID=591990 RepID=UPI0035F1AF0F